MDSFHWFKIHRNTICETRNKCTDSLLRIKFNHNPVENIRIYQNK